MCNRTFAQELNKDCVNQSDSHEVITPNKASGKARLPTLTTTVSGTTRYTAVGVYELTQAA
jgi:hypothetical protein